MTAHATATSAVQALKEGVTDYLFKPLDYDELAIVLDKAIRQRRMSRELADLRSRVSSEGSFHGIIGDSPAMQRIFDLVRTVGPTDALGAHPRRDRHGQGAGGSRPSTPESRRAALPLVIAINCGGPSRTPC